MIAIADIQPRTSTTIREGMKPGSIPHMGVLGRDLAQLAALVTGLTDTQYARTPVGVFTSGIGGHVRHCLDHIQAFLAGLEDGRIDYDQRERSTDVETSRSAALRAIQSLERRLRAMLFQGLERPLRLSVMLTSRGPMIDVATSLGRELAFVVSHTTHHNALVAAIAKTMGVTPPADFGYAPSTLVYQEHATCAQ